jgi:ribosome-associated toxin RatA of RatAB toxin-antitoxin module
MIIFPNIVKKFKSQNIHLVHRNRINMKYLYEIYKILRTT